MNTTISTPAVTLIPARVNPALVSDNGTAITRVAAYCRVSTDEEEQQNSYATQVQYYTDYISSNPDWELVGIFAEESLTIPDSAKLAPPNSVQNSVKVVK